MIFRYVIHDRVLDYLQCGWHIAANLGRWSCLMQWLCECECVQPKPEDHHT